LNGWQKFVIGNGSRKLATVAVSAAAEELLFVLACKTREPTHPPAPFAAFGFWYFTSLLPLFFRLQSLQVQCT